MVTVRETQKIQNDNTRHVVADSPGAKKVRIEWLLTFATGYQAGMGVVRKTGAGGEAYCHVCAAGQELLYGIIELDKKQVNNCTDVYGIAKLIPIITIEGNDGLIMRNLKITDPNADIEPDAPFIAGDGGAFAVSAGTGRVYLRSEYFIADADDPTVLVARISQSLEVA